MSSSMVRKSPARTARKVYPHWIRPLANLAAIFLPAIAFASDPPSLGRVLDARLRAEERDIVPLIEAMPAEKFDFAPTNGEFKGVRTFGQQAKHMATAMYLMSAIVLEQRPPVDTGTDENGPESLRAKNQIVNYVKGAFSFAHRAVLSLNEQNELDLVGSPSGGAKQERIDAAVFLMSHSYDHYGQMVEYLRMNGLTPPSTQAGR